MKMKYNEHEKRKVKNEVRYTMHSERAFTCHMHTSSTSLDVSIKPLHVSHGLKLLLSIFTYKYLFFCCPCHHHLFCSASLWR